MRTYVLCWEYLSTWLCLPVQEVGIVLDLATHWQYDWHWRRAGLCQSNYSCWRSFTKNQGRSAHVNSQEFFMTLFDFLIWQIDRKWNLARKPISNTTWELKVTRQLTGERERLYHGGKSQYIIWFLIWNSNCHHLPKLLKKTSDTF